MGKYIKSHSNFILQKKHQTVDEGTVFYQDQLTVNGISEFSNVKGQIPIYRDGNFLLTTRITNGYTRSMSPRRYLNNGISGDVWTTEVLDNYPVDKDSQIDTIDLKFSYYSLREFSYYGSCVELINASLNDILKTFPAELYVREDAGKGVSDSYMRTGTRSGILTILGSGDYINSISNPFDIDIIKNRSFQEISGESVTNLRFFGHEGYLNYVIIDNEGDSYNVTGWESNSRYLSDGTIFEGSDEEWAQLEKEGKTKKCFLNGDERAQVKIYSEKYSITIKAYQKTSTEIVLNTTSEFVGFHIRPKESVINDWFLNLDRFENLLMQRDSNPIYTCKLEVLNLNEETNDIEGSLQSFTMPLTFGGWNIGGQAFGSYVSNLQSIASKYDEYFCDNLYKNMTHESIKNMDWSVRKFYNAENSDEDYVEPQNNINKMIRLLGREYDEIKFYIDGLGKINVLNYRDDESNMSNYFLSDSLENEGWELVAPYTKTLNEYVEYSGMTLYRETASGSNEFTNYFGGIEFNVNEKENYATIPCVNVSLVRIGSDKYIVQTDNSITVNGKKYEQTTHEGVPCYDIVTDIPYTVRYVMVNGKRYDVDETTKTVTVEYQGEEKTYAVADGQTEVVIAEPVSKNVRIYSFVYDQCPVYGELSESDTAVTFTINRTGLPHNNVPVTEGLETETISLPMTQTGTTGIIQTVGWSNDMKVGAEREFFYDLLDPTQKHYINYTDSYPIDDVSDTVSMSDGTVYSYVRQQEPEDGDKLTLTSNGVDSRACYLTLPFHRTQYDYFEKYGTMDGFFKSVYNGTDKSENAQMGTTRFISGSASDKTITLASISGHVNGFLSCFKLLNTAYTVYDEAGNELTPSDTFSGYELSALDDVKNLPKPNAGFVVGNDWYDYKDEFISLENSGVKKLSVATDYASVCSMVNDTWGWSADVIYSAPSGTPITSSTMNKYDLVGTYRVSFIYAHLYQTNGAESSKGLSLEYWTLTDEIMDILRNSEARIDPIPDAFDYIKNNYPSQWSVGNSMSAPLFCDRQVITVSITESDLDYFDTDEVEVGNPQDIVNTRVISDTSDSVGFVKTSEKTAYGLLYNKAVSLLSKDEILRSIKSKFDITQNSFKCPYGNFTVSFGSRKDFCNLVIGSNIVTSGYIEDWYGYAFVPSIVKIDESKFSIVFSGYTGPSNNDFGGYLSPYNQERCQGFFSYTPSYFLSNKRDIVSYCTVNYSSDIRADGTGITNHLIQKFSNADSIVNYTDMTYSTKRIWDDTSNYAGLSDKLPEGATKIAVVPHNIYMSTLHSSYHRLNLPVIYNSDNEYISTLNDKFVNIYAEREVLNSITIPNSPKEWQNNTAVTESGKIYNYFDSASTMCDNNAINRSSDFAVSSVSGHAHGITTVDRLGWFYFKNSSITLDELGYQAYVKNDENSYTYHIPSDMSIIVYNESAGEYQSESGGSLSDLPDGVYYVADDGAGLFGSKTYTVQTYKDFVVGFSGTEEREEQKELKATVESEPHTQHVDNYYYPVTECVTDDDTKYPLHREFSDDSDYEYTPYDCSLDTTCGGYFYKKCCVKENANGRPTKVEKTPYTEYNGHKLYLCNCDCNDAYMTVIVNHVEYSAYSSANTIVIEDTVCPVYYEDIMYYRIDNYSDTRTYDANDVMYRFYKNLRLNSRSLLRKKGTVEGLESMLGLFGLKSKRWYDGLTVMQQKSWGWYDYVIKEYTCFTDKIEDLYDKKLSMGKIAYYNQQKSLSHSNADSNTNRYDGLPVKTVSFYKDKFGNLTNQQYSPDFSVNTEYRKDLYPYFDHDKRYDGDTYFQMNGGWLPIYPFRFSKNDDIMLPYMNGYQIMKGLHTETLRNVRSFQTLEELLDVAKSSVLNDQIVEVQDLSTVYAIVNGRLFEVFTESFILEDEAGVKKETKCSYIKTFVRNHSLEVGNTFYFGDIYISDPLAYCYDDEDELHDYVRHYDLEEENDGKMIRIFLYKLDDLDQKVPVDVDKDLLIDKEGNLYVEIVLNDSENDHVFDVFKNDEDSMSHYFKLANVDYADTLSVYGWYQLALTDPDAIRLDSIVDNFKGNNPHSDMFCKYDNGFEYMARFAQLFRFPIENNSFIIRNFGYNGIGTYAEELPIIEEIGFDNLVSLSGDVSKYSVSGDQINTRDNYNMQEDSKIHSFCNFYTNNIDSVNVNKSVHKAINKYGLCETVDMNGNNELFYGFNPTYNEASGSVYNLSNTPNVNSGYETSESDTYTRNSEDKEDYHTERIMNNKILDINFFTDYEYYTKTYLEKYKYIDDVILFYLQQLIPSTTICRVNFGGLLKYLIKEGAVFEVGSDGTLSVKQADCGSVVVEYLNEIRVDKINKIC